MKKPFWGWAFLLLLIASMYCGKVMRQGWIPHDEGVMGQMAERALHGEIPHRDFDELYSGALTWLNALAFRVLGTTLFSLRIPLLLFYLLFLLTVYALVSRWLSPFKSALFGIACLGWGLPVYFAALPSWYLSFFAGYGTLCFMKHIESGQRRWVLAAGIFAGLSICFKILGVYFLMAGMLFLIYRETVLAETHANTQSPESSIPTVVMSQSFIVVLIIGSLAAILWRQLTIKEFIHFLLPGMVLGLMPFYEVAYFRSRISTGRQLFFVQFLFLMGAAIPLLGFLTIFWKNHALTALYQGLFVQSLQHYQFASLALPPTWTILYIAPIVLLYIGSSLKGAAFPRWLLYVVLGTMAFFVLKGGQPRIYRGIWSTVRPLVSWLVLFGALRLNSAMTTRLSALKRQRLFLILTVMAFVSIVQFPFSGGIYFCYVAPFVGLAAVAVFQDSAQRWHELGVSVIAAYAAFGFLWLTRGVPAFAGYLYAPKSFSTLLLPQRADLRIGEAQCAVYETLIREIQTHSAGTDFIYAGPDCPEVYFLSGKRNPTRVFFEFLAPEDASVDLILRAIDDHHIKVAVLDADPEFSPHMSKTLYQQIAQRFHHHEDINQFRLFW